MNQLQNKQRLLLSMAFLMPFSFSIWMVLINNFTIEVAQFNGQQIGILQSLREIPGFLAFTAVYILLVLNEQRFALISLFVLGFGIAITGYFPSAYGLYFTTVIMSIGFHYFETCNQSLTLQWIPASQTAGFMGKALAVKGGASVIAYGLLWLLLEFYHIEYKYLYLVFGSIAMFAVLYFAWRYPLFTTEHAQHKHLVLRPRYALFYLLTFFSGARRQIFVVFAGFLMVERFDYSASNIALLFLVNQVFNMLFASAIGRWVGRIGERKALCIEYIGLIIVFSGYAVVDSAVAAAVLYVVDHLFFALAIAVKTYFQKIADPKDIASTAGVSFTINHIAAVVLPGLLGMLWLVQPSLVFWIGALIALCSLLCSLLIPAIPKPGKEWLLFKTA
ncbi:MFS transporter [Alginatibacterium sediminis]|uniref:MFS transporter n=1 Tax=Alginatibacterium sediminis TaxID=2164068 RepID=A0A420EGM4_9ALTE|nr:MFS transporter [Alginatibacterium sediminis]RKF19839.1 MFS transporter [Alginatibacterium sediminis]